MLDSSKKTITTFTDLIVWQKSHLVVIDIYKITASFPREEQFGLTSQMHRCAVSITSNIAEGFGRKSASEKDQFYAIASGSITELKNQLLIARDIDLIDKKRFDKIADKTNEAHKILNGLRKANKKKGADAKIQNLASNI
jgi:four helix bundle protein